MGTAPGRLSSGRNYCLAAGLSESGAEPPDGCFAGGGRRAADAGAVLVGPGDDAVAGGEDGAGAAVCDGSAFVLLIGGIEAADGNVMFDPAGAPVPPPLLDASGRGRVGQFTA